MKNIFKINITTYLLLLSILLCGYFNYLLIISLILIIHDLGHIFFLKLFKIKINNIIILPFGSIINSDLKLNTASYKIFIISIAGILFQLILSFIMNYLHTYGLINEISINIFNYYNKLIMIFNLIPIVSLDGSKILKSGVECLFKYLTTIKLINLISIISLIILILTNFNNLSIIIIIIYLLIKIIENIKNTNYIYHNFLIERTLYHVKHKKIKYINNINSLYKNKYNFINNIPEEKYLKTHIFPNINWLLSISLLLSYCL
mgnify:CR=1 FL=1